MKLQLHELVKVSNNSRLTGEVLTILNGKLSDAESRTMSEWLRLVEREAFSKQQAAKRRMW